jgi:hypothetical protein
MVGKPQGKTPLVRVRRKWEDNIKMNPRVIEWGGMDGIDVVQNREKLRALVSTVTNLRVAQNIGKSLNNRATQLEITAL